MEVKAILFDTRSIQQYIFSGNKLKTNIGASYLVDRVFDDVLLNVLRDKFDNEADLTSWKEDRSENFDWADIKAAKIAYIGGGNALVLLAESVEDTDIEGIVEDFTKRLLVEYPGLKTGAAIGRLSLGENGSLRKGQGDTENCLTKLVHQLKAQQNRVFPQVTIPYSGLTLSCELDGENATHYSKKLGRFISAESARKLSIEEEAEQALLSKLNQVWEAKQRLSEEYKFPSEIEKLGMMEAEDYFAIVHVDGNNMGKKFANCETLTQRKNKSLKVSEVTARAFCRLVESILPELEIYEKGKIIKLAKKKGTTYLPVRPLVLGGDDMTFVCPAKLAFRYAERVMDFMKADADSIDTCAGIAILDSSYPFFRGYVLAEQLCDAAKKKMRMEKEEDTCWMDYVILHGEQAPTLEQIRTQEYTAYNGNSLHFGPYRMDADTSQARSFQNLKQAVYEMNYGDKKLPMGKIKELRDIITQDEGKREEFIAQLKNMKYTLPKISVWEDFEKTLWKNGETPYVDVIELIDFYVPEEVTNRG